MWLAGRGSSLQPLQPLLILLVGLVGLVSAQEAESVSATLRQAARTAREARRAIEPIDPVQLPIGVFDSGTGGLAVLEAILAIDVFDNDSGQPLAGGDGLPDFHREAFVYLADQANMPYGNYPQVGRADFLEQLIVKDAEFLLGRSYFPDADSPPARDKLPVKALVIACNTATAYGQRHLEVLVEQAELELPVVGVVAAGVRGALDSLAEGQAATIGVLATQATVGTEAYPRNIRTELARRGFVPDSPQIGVVQQGSLGLAGAIDGVEEFVDLEATSTRPRDGYQGPSPDHPSAPLDRELLQRYGFDFDHHGILYDGPRDHPTTIQLNSVMNYLRYDLVSLLERLRRAPHPQPLAAIILACTHFPYYAEEFEDELQRLADYQEDGRYLYRDLLAMPVRLVDPAHYAARELYQRLEQEQSLRSCSGIGRGVQETRDRPEALAAENGTNLFGQPTRGEFYISIPCRQHPQVQLSPQGHFTYAYKYSPQRPPVGTDYRQVPLRHRKLDAETAARLRSQLPAVWTLLDEFNRENPKARVLPAGPCAPPVRACSPNCRDGLLPGHRRPQIETGRTARDRPAADSGTNIIVTKATGFSSQLLDFSVRVPEIP